VGWGQDIKESGEKDAFVRNAGDMGDATKTLKIEQKGVEG